MKGNFTNVIVIFFTVQGFYPMNQILYPSQLTLYLISSFHLNINWLISRGIYHREDVVLYIQPTQDINRVKASDLISQHGLILAAFLVCFHSEIEIGSRMVGFIQKDTSERFEIIVIIIIDYYYWSCLVIIGYQYMLNI